MKEIGTDEVGELNADVLAASTSLRSTGRRAGVHTLRLVAEEAEDTNDGISKRFQDGLIVGGDGVVTGRYRVAKNSALGCAQELMEIAFQPPCLRGGQPVQRSLADQEGAVPGFLPLVLV